MRAPPRRERDLEEHQSSVHGTWQREKWSETSQTRMRLKFFLHDPDATGQRAPVDRISFSMSRRAPFPTRPDFARGARAWAQAEVLMHFELLKLLDGHRGAMRHAGGRTAASC